MKAWVYNRYGSPEEMEYSEISIPKAGHGELLVKIEATCINPADWKVRSGLLKIITGFDFPKGMGSDFSGKVEEVGAGVLDFQKGDEVLGVLSFRKLGTFAEYAVSPVRTTLKKLESLGFQDASCLGIAGCTALSVLGSMDLQGLEVLIVGCTGGVGHIALQIAKMYGAKVMGVCNSSRFDIAKSLGADSLIDYQSGNVIDRLKNQGRQFDVIFDTPGTLEVHAVSQIMKEKSSYFSIAPKPSNFLFAVSNLWKKKKSIPVFARTKKEYLQQLQQWIVDGKLKILIGKSAPLSQAQEIFRSLEKGNSGIPGKVVLIP